MKTTRIFGRTILNKCFSKMTAEIRSILMSLLLTIAESESYLEEKTKHADSIGWHLKNICIDDFKLMLDSFFETLLKTIKRMNLGKVTLAFDETYIPYFGSKWSLWIHGYNNNVKGAKGSYMFMVCSIVLGEKRFVLYAYPMYRGQETHQVVNDILTKVKKYLHVNLILLDRGFCHKKTVWALKKQEVDYIILCPKWKNVKKFLENGELEVIEYTKVNFNKTNHDLEMRYLLAYNMFGHNWAFVSNIKMNMLAMILTYKGRWGIETTFRVMDNADIKSKSTKIVIRTFFFLISIVLYNVWLEFKEEKPITFNSYLNNLALANTPLENLIEDWIRARELFNMEISNENKKILSSFNDILYNYKINEISKMSI